MRRDRRSLLRTLALLAATGSGTAWAASKVVIGEPVPAFSVETLADKNLDITDLRGKRVLVFMWASW